MRYETFEQWRDHLEKMNGEPMNPKVAQQFRKTWEKGEASGIAKTHEDLRDVIEESTTVIRAQGEIIDKKDAQIDSLLKALAVAKEVLDPSACTYEEIEDFCEGGEMMDSILEERNKQEAQKPNQEAPKK